MKMKMMVGAANASEMDTVSGLEGLCALGQALVRELSACKARHEPYLK